MSEETFDLNTSTDYMEIAAVMLDKIEEKTSEDDKSISINEIVSVKDYIDRISDIAINTPMFANAQDRFEEFINHIKNHPELSTPASKALESFNHFTSKVCTAPTQMHMRGAVLLTVPAIKQFLDEYINSQEDKG